MAQEEALLGLATTRELMEELKSRSEVGSVDGTFDADVASDMDIYLQGCSLEFLNYRTVDHG